MRDRGPGLPAGAPSRVFERFYSTKRDGMGMGLAIARSIVEAHAGTLDAENADGGGARFWFRIPVHEDAAVAAATGPGMSRKPGCGNSPANVAVRPARKKIGESLWPQVPVAARAARERGSGTLACLLMLSVAWAYVTSLDRRLAVLLCPLFLATATTARGARRPSGRGAC